MSVRFSSSLVRSSLSHGGVGYFPLRQFCGVGHWLIYFVTIYISIDIKRIFLDDGELINSGDIGFPIYFALRICNRFPILVLGG